MTLEANLFMFLFFWHNVVICPELSQSKIQAIYPKSLQNVKSKKVRKDNQVIVPTNRHNDNRVPM